MFIWIFPCLRVSKIIFQKKKIQTQWDFKFGQKPSTKLVILGILLVLFYVILAIAICKRMLQILRISSVLWIVWAAVAFKHCDFEVLITKGTCCIFFYLLDPILVKISWNRYQSYEGSSWRLTLTESNNSAKEQAQETRHLVRWHCRRLGLAAAGLVLRPGERGEWEYMNYWRWPLAWPRHSVTLTWAVPACLSL